MIGGMAALKKYLEYPEIARKAGIEAQVVVGVLVDEKGNTVKTQILKGTGSKLGFEEAASKALMRMKWKPAYQRDKPVKVWISIPVRFKLQDTK
jgi:protein TonB